jgi:hypothetical protein
MARQVVALVILVILYKPLNPTNMSSHIYLITFVSQTIGLLRL